MRRSVVCIGIAAASGQLPAQTLLQPVTVTATREPQLQARSAADVVVIDAATIRDRPADSVEDLLRREAGLQLSRNGGPGQNAAVFIRGSASGNTLVLIDGVRVGAATLGLVEFESLGLDQIERIEVLRGPASSLYGADAVGGVVQIFTRRGEGAPRLRAHAAVGGYASRRGDVAVSGSQGGFDYAAALGHERSDGVSALRPDDAFGNYNPDRDGYRRSTGQLNFGYAPAPGHRVGIKLVESRLRSQYDASEFLPPTFAADATPDFRNRLDTRVIAADYRGRLGADLTTTVQLARNVDDLVSGATQPDRFRTVREQATWQGAWRLADHSQLLLAYEHLGERAQTDGYDRKRNTDALVLGYTGSFDVHSLQLDLRRDDNSVYGGRTTGRVGWSVALAPGWKLRALAGTTFRAPSFNDLYFPDYGIDTIRPERGRSVEAGVDWRSGDSAASLTVYRNRVRDLIAYEPDPTGTVCPSGYFGCAANVGRARLQGATLTASHRVGDLNLHGVADVLDAKDSDTGRRLNRRAARQLSFGGDYAIGDVTLGADVLNVGARPDGGVRLGSYTTLDLTARWRFAPRWRLEARLLNAADRDIEPARDYQALGRQGWIGVRYDSGGSGGGER